MITHIFILVLWFLAGFSFALSLGADRATATRLGGVTLASAMFFIIAIALPNAHMRRIFFEGPRPDEEGELVIGCYNFMPAAIILVASIIWLIRTIISL